jgi:hypothetical protein
MYSSKTECSVDLYRHPVIPVIRFTIYTASAATIRFVHTGEPVLWPFAALLVLVGLLGNVRVRVEADGLEATWLWLSRRVGWGDIADAKAKYELIGGRVRVWLKSGEVLSLVGSNRRSVAALVDAIQDNMTGRDKDDGQVVTNGKPLPWWLSNWRRRVNAAAISPQSIG